MPDPAPGQGFVEGLSFTIFLLTILIQQFWFDTLFPLYVSNCCNGFFTHTWFFGIGNVVIVAILAFFGVLTRPEVDDFPRLSEKVYDRKIISIFLWIIYASWFVIKLYLMTTLPTDNVGDTVVQLNDSSILNNFSSVDVVNQSVNVIYFAEALVHDQPHILVFMISLSCLSFSGLVSSHRYDDMQSATQDGLSFMATVVAADISDSGFLLEQTFLKETQTVFIVYPRLKPVMIFFSLLGVFIPAVSLFKVGYKKTYWCFGIAIIHTAINFLIIFHSIFH